MECRKVQLWSLQFCSANNSAASLSIHLMYWKIAIAPGMVRGEIEGQESKDTYVETVNYLLNIYA